MRPLSTKTTPPNELQRARERREDLKLRGLCTRCMEPNDRAGEKAKNGHTASECTACRDRARREAAAARRAAKRKVEEMRRALGLES